MKPIPLALLTLAAALLLLGATAADWATVTTSEVVGETDDGQPITFERSEPVAGPEVAGDLFAVGLVALVVAGFAVRWPLAGAVLLLLGSLAGIEAFDGLQPARGSPTAAPAIALVAALGLSGCGVALLMLGLRRRRGADPAGAGDPARPEPPSRYTVEAVRGEVPPPAVGEVDEWELAVADDFEPPAGEDHP